ncbi:MAG: hypothetical protein ACE5FT_05745, partial [Candidatus Nanoarchaeia archaeon]
TIKTAKTPAGTIKQNAMLFEFAGLYEFNDKTMAANLLNPDESQINPSDEAHEVTKRNVELQSVKETREFSWEIPFALVAMALMLLELVYIKWRGDI